MKVRKIKSSNLKGYLTLDIDGISCTVSEGQYSSVGAPLAGDEITEEVFAVISNFGEYNRIKKKALNILSFGDNSRLGLIFKLVRAGAPRSLAERVADEMMSFGYINEERQAERLIAEAVSVHLLGPRKFIPKFVAKGYSSDTLRSVEKKLLSEELISYSEAKEKLISTLGENPSREDVQKILYKHGF